MEQQKTSTGTLTEKDWQSFSEAVSETNPTARAQALKGFTEYLHREGKLAPFAEILHECSGIIEESSAS